MLPSPRMVCSSHAAPAFPVPSRKQSCLPQRKDKSAAFRPVDSPPPLTLFFFTRQQNMDKELIDRAEVIRKELVQLRDSL